MKIKKINMSMLKMFFLFLYLISISAYQLGSGFDAIFVRLSFVMLVGISIFSYPYLKIRLTEQLRWIIVFWSFYFISMIWAKDINDTMYYINNFIQIFGLSISIPLIITNRHDIEKFLNLFILSMLWVVIRLIIKTPIESWGTERLGATIGLNPNTLGMRLVIVALICIYMFHKTWENKKVSRRKLKLFAYTAMFFIFNTISLFSGSKKSLLFLISGVFIYEIVITKGWKVLIKIILLMATVSFLIYLMFNNEQLYRVIGRRLERTILTLNGTASGLSIDQSLLERNYFISKAKELFGNNPILGYGGNNFVTYMRETGYSHVAYCHNNYFELLATLGLVGFVIYYYMWFRSAIRLLSSYIKYHDNLCLLFTILIFAQFVMDYGVVSYIGEFTQLILIIGIMINKYINKEVRK